MTDSTTTPHQSSTQPGVPPSIKLRYLSALAAAALVFTTVAWRVLQPLDPRGPLTLMAGTHRLTSIVLMLLVAGAASGLAIAIAGRRSGLVGPLAVAVGLAALNWRGAQADLLAGYAMPHTGWSLTRLVVELWVWTAIIGVGVVIGGWSDGILAVREEQDWRGSLIVGAGSSIGGILLAAAVGLQLVRFFGGNPEDPVLKQQVYFSVAMAMFLACGIAHAVFQPRNRSWVVLAAALTGTAAYLWSGPGNASLTVLRTLPNVVSRPLPIEYAAMGCFGGLLGVVFTVGLMRSLGMETSPASAKS